MAKMRPSLVARARNQMRQRIENDRLRMSNSVPPATLNESLEVLSLFERCTNYKKVLICDEEIMGTHLLGQ